MSVLPAGSAIPEPQRGRPRELEKYRADLRESAARLYSAGFKRAEVARTILDHLAPDTAALQAKYPDRTIRRRKRLTSAKRKLRRMEMDQAFRDQVWAQSVVKMDLATGEILNGVLQKAKRGRVDAARLALEVTGRHNPKGDQSPPVVNLSINGVPRPQMVGEVVEGEVVAEEES